MIWALISSTPVCSGKSSTSFWRPFIGAVAGSFARPRASGLVPALIHGFSALRFPLRSGEEEGLNCYVKSFSKVFTTFARDPCVFSSFLRVLCNNFVPPLLTQ
jgi:hypothetical protein